MKTIYLITSAVLLSLLFETALMAQETSKKSKAYGGVGYFETGLLFFDFKEINEAFKIYQIPELTVSSISFGGGGHAVISNFIIGGEGQGYFGAISENDHYKISHGGGYGFFNLGYLLLNKPSTKVYPLIGFGGGSVAVSITDKVILPNSFNDILSSPARQSHINTGGFTMNFSLSTDFFVAGQRSERVSGGFFVGLRVGYTFQLSGYYWYLDKQSLSDSPNSGMSGPYIRLTFGGGAITIN